MFIKLQQEFQSVRYPTYYHTQSNNYNILFTRIEYLRVTIQWECKDILHICTCKNEECMTYRSN